MYILEIETEHPILKVTRQAVPEMEFTYLTERTLRDTGETRMLFEVSGGDFDAFDAAMRSDPTIATFEHISGDDTDRLYRITYNEDAEVESPMDLLFEHDARIVDTEAVDQGWWVRIHFPTEAGLQAFIDWFSDHDIRYTILKVFSRTHLALKDLPLLSEKQDEAIRLAYRNGYFDVPRKVDINSLADQVGISDTAFSQRLRRGLSKILEQEGFHLEQNG